MNRKWLIGLGIGLAVITLAPTYTYVRKEVANTWTAVQTFQSGMIAGSGTFVFGTGTATSSASTITIPGSGTLRGIRVASPATNTDIFYIAVDGTATTSSLPVNPGDIMDLPCNSGLLYVVAGSGTQTVNITAFYN